MKRNDLSKEVLHKSNFNKYCRFKTKTYLKLVYPFILKSGLVSSDELELFLLRGLVRGNILEIRDSSDGGENLAMDLQRPRRTGTMHLHVAFLVLNGDGLSCFFISCS